MSDAEFRRSLANCSSWRTADYFWTWHKSFPHMTLADMHAKIEADRAAAEAAEWEAEQAYADRFERSEAELLAEQADLEEAEEAAPELAEAHARIAKAEETERVARAAMEAAEKAFAEAAPETHTETSTEVYFFLQDTLRIAYEMARAATAEARHPGLAAAAAAGQAREVITAVPPRGRPAAPAPAVDAEPLDRLRQQSPPLGAPEARQRPPAADAEEELFSSSTSSPEAEEYEAEEADWYDQKERERSGP